MWRKKVRVLEVGGAELLKGKGGAERWRVEAMWRATGSPLPDMGYSSNV
jgi:hypothetical protein